MSVLDLGSILLIIVINSACVKVPNSNGNELSYIAEFTSDIQHISGKDNIVADTLSRPPTQPEQQAAAVAAVAASPAILDYGELAAGQQGCPLVEKAASASSLRIRPVEIGGVTLLCDLSTGAARPVIPAAHRRAVFNAFHGLAHPSRGEYLRLGWCGQAWRLISTSGARTASSAPGAR
jgi:hypothetical protein